MGTRAACTTNHLTPLRRNAMLTSWLGSRRDFLRVSGGLAVAGLTLPNPLTQLMAAEGRGTAKSCILVYLLGGPPHQDMFDLKPDAPAEFRGPFQPIPTNVPGTQIC